MRMNTAASGLILLSCRQSYRILQDVVETVGSLDDGIVGGWISTRLQQARLDSQRNGDRVTNLAGWSWEEAPPPDLVGGRRRR